jgi:glycopeptide antibiotics resistance protein
VLDQGLLVLPTAILAIWIAVRGLRRQLGTWVITLQLVGLVHAAAVIAVAFFPLPVQRELIDAFRATQVAHNNLLPMGSLIGAIASGATPSVIYQSVGNLLMLMPLGAYLPMLLPAARNARTTVLAGFGVSVSIELAQLAISSMLGYTYKIADVDDVILNTAGVAIGFGMYWLLSRWLPDLRFNPSVSQV